MDLSQWSSAHNVAINLAVVATLLFFTISILKDILYVLSSINSNLDNINKDLDILSARVMDYLSDKRV